MKLYTLIFALVLAGWVQSFTRPAGARPEDTGGSSEVASAARLKAFRTLLESIPTLEDTLQAHPLERFLYESISGFGIGPDTMSYVDLCRRVGELKSKTSSALAGATIDKFQSALELAYGLYRIGFEHEAMLWLSEIDRFAHNGEFRSRARRLIIFHSLVTNNATLLEPLVEGWDEQLLSGEDGREAALAMLSALYTLGRDETLERLLKVIPGPEPYRSFFAARLLVDRGDYAAAIRYLPDVLAESAVQTPIDYRFAVLLLAVKAEWQSGSVSAADQECRLLAGRTARYVKDWALLELANRSLQTGRTEDSAEIFGQLCNSDGEGMWKQLSCRLTEYLQKYRSSQEGTN